MDKEKTEHLELLLHTLKNIATIESCYIQLLQKNDCLNEQCKKYLETLCKANNRYQPIFEAIASLLSKEIPSS